MKQSQIKLARDGTWYDGSDEITHERTVQLFNKSVFKKGTQYYLKGEKSPVPIEVEETAFFVKSVSANKNGWIVSLSDETNESLDPTTLQLSPHGGFLCTIKNQSCHALFLKKAYDQFAKFIDARDGYLGIAINNVFYPLQRDIKKVGKANASQAKAAKDKKPVKKSNKKSSPAKKRAKSK